MSNLLKYSTPAERMRGCSLAEAGGVFTGSDNIIHNLQGNEFNTNQISLVWDFIPYFNWDEDLLRVFFDTDTGKQYRFYKNNNVSGNILVGYIGNALVFIIASNLYSQYWNINERNLIVATGESGNNKYYFNNILVKQASTVWSHKSPLKLFLGSLNNNTNYFFGKITPLKIYKRILTPQEISDIWNNSTYNYKNKYLIHYPMTAATHTGSQTLDVSGNDLHGTLVGSPTKLAGQGYSFNGSDQYITFPEQTFTGEFTLGIFNKPGMKSLDGFFGHSVDTNRVLLFISGKVFVRVVSTSDSTVESAGAVVNFIGLTRDSDNKVDLYINNNKYRLFGDVAQVGDSIWDYIGRTESATQFLDGNVYETVIDDKCLTPTQMHDLYTDRFGLDI